MRRRRRTLRELAEVGWMKTLMLLLGLPLLRFAAAPASRHALAHSLADAADREDIGHAVRTQKR
jgi:hypothetical protein